MKMKKLSIFFRQRLSFVLIGLFLISLLLYGYSQKIGLNSIYSQVLTSLAEDCRKNGETGKALRFIHKAINLDPLNGEAYYQQGLLFHLRGKEFFEQEANSYRWAIAQDSSLREAYFRLAMLYYHQEDYDAAIRYLKHKTDQKMLKLNYVDFYYYLGSSFERKGNYMSAFSYYSDVLKAGKDDSEIIEKLKNIYKMISPTEKLRFKHYVARMRIYNNHRMADIVEKIMLSE